MSGDLPTKQELLQALSLVGKLISTVHSAHTSQAVALTTLIQAMADNNQLTSEQFKEIDAAMEAMISSMEPIEGEQRRLLQWVKDYADG